MKIFSTRKSQTTPFIIVAVIIVCGIGLYFFIRQHTQISAVQPDISPIHNFVNNCIQKTAEDAVYQIGDTGGYFSVPSLSTDNHIAYYLYDGKNYMPTREKIKTELSNYMNTMLFFCVRGFEDFNDFTVRQGEIRTEVTIEDERVIFSVRYPLSFQKGENSYSLNQFTGEVPVRLGVIYDVNEEIMREQMREPHAICINCITNLAEKHDLYVDLHDYENETVLFYIVDRNSQIQEEDYLFRFANKYETI